MRLLVASAIWPHSGHTTRAANIVTHELVAALAEQPDVQVAYLKVDRAGDPAPDEPEKAGLADLREKGVDIRPVVTIPAPAEGAGAVKKLLAPSEADFYPETAYADRVHKAIEAFNADVVLVPWSEWVTALCADAPARRFAYYGNPDHKSGLLRAKFTRRHGGTWASTFKAELYCMRLKQIHLEIMRRYDFLGNVAANDAAFYRDEGHPNAFYIQNLWIDRFGPSWRERRAALEKQHPALIIGNVGKLFGTANQYGLEVLGNEILPALRNATEQDTWKVRLLGSGTLPPSVEGGLRGSDVEVSGFVPDIDDAILEAQVFLCANNGSDYKVGHTRYLHAWTLGACVVAHADASLSMPEIRDGDNALLGTTSADVAIRVKEALADPVLRLRMGEAGYETYRTAFSAQRVARDILARIDGTLTGDGIPT